MGSQSRLYPPRLMFAGPLLCACRKWLLGSVFPEGLESHQHLCSCKSHQMRRGEISNQQEKGGLVAFMTPKPLRSQLQAQLSQGSDFGLRTCPSPSLRLLPQDWSLQLRGPSRLWHSGREGQAAWLPARLCDPQHIIFLCLSVLIRQMTVIGTPLSWLAGKDKTPSMSSAWHGV